jgi:hypothetical protein
MTNFIRLKFLHLSNVNSPQWSPFAFWVWSVSSWRKKN